MSVTFHPEPAPTIGWRLADYFGGADPRLFGSYQQARDALVAAKEQGTILPGCTDPDEAALGDGYRLDEVTADGDDVPTMNVSNVNACHLLGLLGFTGDDMDERIGSMDAEAFLGRVLTALALAPADAGVPAYETAGAGGATVVECGRRPGYHQDILERLRELADWSRARQRTVCWN